MHDNLFQAWEFLTKTLQDLGYKMKIKETFKACSHCKEVVPGVIQMTLAGLTSYHDICTACFHEFHLSIVYKSMWLEIETENTLSRTSLDPKLHLLKLWDVSLKLEALWDEYCE